MTSSSPWLDPRLPESERIEALLAEMTLEELVGQLHQSPNIDPLDDADAALLSAGRVGSTLLASGATAGNVRDTGVTRDRIDTIQRAAMQSRLGIPLLIGRDVIHGHRTVFPIPLGLAASFDEDLVEQVGRRASAEAVSDGITWVFAPMLDVVDDARWGRVAESFGESSVLTARLGAASVRGLQAEGVVAACAKHFVGYGLSRGGRDYARVDVGEITLRNTHLRPFRAAVEAGVASVMAAFSDVDGIPMHSHRRLLRDVLKGEWGFEGIVVADWNGIGELVAHGVAADLRDAASQAIEAGVDVDMVSGAYASHLADLVTSGEVDLALVEDAARRVLRVKMRLGLFDRGHRALPGSDSAPVADIDRALARRAAAASLVTLAPDAVPPLAALDEPVLFTGAYVHERASLMGTWVLDGDPVEVPTLAEALAEAASRRDDAPTLVFDDGAFPDRTLRLAREAGTTVAFVGEHSIRSGEDSVASDIGLPPGQLDVLRALRRVSARLIVVVFAGRPLDLAGVIEMADAVVLAWHPGVEGAPALADLLLAGGFAHGRSPMTLPRSVGHLPIAHTERPSGRPLPPNPRGFGRYLDAPEAPVAAFGAGHSPISYGSLRGTSQVSRIDGHLELELDLHNPSDAPHRESVLLFARDHVAEITRPLRELADFTVVDVPADGEALARFQVPSSALGYHGRDGRFRVDTGRITLTAGWGRADASDLEVTVVDGDPETGG